MMLSCVRLLLLIVVDLLMTTDCTGRGIKLNSYCTYDTIARHAAVTSLLGGRGTAGSHDNNYVTGFGKTCSSHIHFQL